MSAPPPFEGFQFDSQLRTEIPDSFFREFLAQINHLGELKLLLYLFYTLGRSEAPAPAIRRADLEADSVFLAGLGESPAEQIAALGDALERCVQRASLLRTVDPSGASLYFLNTPRGRAAMEGLRQGKWSPADLQTGSPPPPERANIFKLYEEHIGPLTPMIAETLQDAERNYPPDVIERAFRAAVENNVRRWRYIEAILRDWKSKGAHEREDLRNAEKDRRKYVEGDLSDFIKR